MTEWRPIQGLEYYEVSSDGQVRSIGRLITEKGGRERWLAGRVLRPRFSGKYLAFQAGRGRNYYIHRAVAEAWLGSPPEGFPQVNHIDGDKLNNSVGNLEWSNHRHNTLHALDMGLNPGRGEGHHNAKLKREDVLKIRSLFFKVTDTDIAREFGVSDRTINNIRHGQTWAHLK